MNHIKTNVFFIFKKNMRKKILDLVTSVTVKSRVKPKYPVNKRFVYMERKINS